jgi:hypothetical protein
MGDDTMMLRRCRFCDMASGRCRVDAGVRGGDETELKKGGNLGQARPLKTRCLAALDRIFPKEGDSGPSSESESEISTLLRYDMID